MHPILSSVCCLLFCFLLKRFFFRSPDCACLPFISPPKGLWHPKSCGDTRSSYPGPACHKGSSLQYFVLLPLLQGCTSTSSSVASQSVRSFPGGWFQLPCVSQWPVLRQGKLTLPRHTMLNSRVSLHGAEILHGQANASQSAASESL